MKNTLYTNTGKVRSVIGLLVVTFATTAVSLYTPQIVEFIVKSTKTGKEKASEVLHKGKHQYAVAERLYDGTIRDTGKRVWR